MESQHRIIFSVLLFTVLSSFIASKLYMERTIEGWIKDRISAELHEKAKTVKGFLATVAPNSSTENLDPLIDKISEHSIHRVTIVDNDGYILADSALNPKQIASAENHKNRAEFLSATQSSPGLMVRFSRTENYDMMYLAVPAKVNQHPGFVRVAISLSEVNKYLQHFRQIYIVIGLVSSSVLIVLLFYTYFYP